MKIRAMLAGLAVASWVSAAAPAGAEVQLTIENGAVWLTATGATVREILAEWARVGQTRIVNGEKVPGGPVTLQLTNEPEEQRARYDPPRRERLHGGAAADRHRQRVALRSHRCPADEQRAPERAAGPAPPPQPAFQPQQPAFTPPQFPPGIPIPTGNDDQDDAPPPRAVMPNPRNPVFNGIPQLPPEIFQQQQLQQQAAPAARAPTVVRRSGTRRACRRADSRDDRAAARTAGTGADGRAPATRSALSSHGARRRGERGNRGRDAPAGAASPRRSAHAEGGAHESRRREGPRPRRDRVASGRHRARQAAARLHRAVHQGRTQPISRRRKQPRSSSSRRTCRPPLIPQSSSAPSTKRSRKPARPRAKDLGRVMKAAMARLAGQNVDGKAVNELVRRKLSPETARPTPAGPEAGPANRPACRTRPSRGRQRGRTGLARRAAWPARPRSPAACSASSAIRCSPRMFGAGNAMDAFVVAFRIPNLVRDLFAEGAMSAAFVPAFTGQLTRHGRDRRLAPGQQRAQRARSCSRAPSWCWQPSSPARS